MSELKIPRIAGDTALVPLTPDELKAVRRSVKGSIDLYRGYVKLMPETPQMKRKQAMIRKRLALLWSAQKKLK